MERETGIEPATNGLGSRDSTTELLPLSESAKCNTAHLRSQFWYRRRKEVFSARKRSSIRQDQGVPSAGEDASLSASWLNRSRREQQRE